MTTHSMLPDDLTAEMERLGQRPYAEIGVPMYVVLEDLTAAAPAAIRKDGNPDLAAAFTEAIGLVEARKGTVEAADIARVIEVLADRTFLDRPFSELADGDVAET